MNNFELIDDYLANRLKGAEREGFESQLAHDPALKSEVDLQVQIVEGIRQARVMELKSMLSKVPVGGTVVEFSILRIAAGVVLAGVVSAAAYYYYGSDGFPPIENAAADITKTEDVKPEPKQPEQVAPQEDETDRTATPEKEEEKPAKKDAAEVVKPAVKPALEVADPSSELSEENQPLAGNPAAGTKADISPSHVQVEMDSSNKKYNFHYQFADHKLMLYGSFDRSLYEVLEINSGNHALFLYYKDNFYLLDETQQKVTRLAPIEDQELVKKLREYRSR